MKRAQILLLLIFLFISSLTIAQTSRSTSAAANKSWTKFYAAFRAAVNKRDRATLKTMIAPAFDCEPVLHGSTSDQIIKGLDQGQYGGWRQLRKNVASNTFIFGGRRFTKYNHYYFEFGADGQWRWAGCSPEFEGI